MTDRRSLAELGAYIDWEGGLDSFLHHGWQPGDTPIEIWDEWDRMVGKWLDWQSLADPLHAKIDAAYQTAQREGTLE